MITKAMEATVDYLRGRKNAYKFTFSYNNPAARQVLADLAIFCRANETCVIPGDRDKTLILEGRREVFLRLQQHLNLSPEQLFELYTGKGLT